MTGDFASIALDAVEVCEAATRYIRLYRQCVSFDGKGRVGAFVMFSDAERVYFPHFRAGIIVDMSLTTDIGVEVNRQGPGAKVLRRGARAGREFGLNGFAEHFLGDRRKGRKRPQQSTNSSARIS